MQSELARCPPTEVPAEQQIQEVASGQRAEEVDVRAGGRLCAGGCRLCAGGSRRSYDWRAELRVPGDKKSHRGVMGARNY